MKIKTGDIVRLLPLKNIKKLYNWKMTNTGGVLVEGRTINEDMFDMFGKSWKVNKTMYGTGMYDFTLSGPKGTWAYSKDWIDDGNIIIIDVDELFEGIEL